MVCSSVCNYQHLSTMLCLFNTTVVDIPCTNDSIRLVNGTTNGTTGEVEVCSGGEWGTENVEDSDAEELCRVLGYQQVVGE